MLCEESFHYFKLFCFKVFRAPNTILFWEDLEGELRINYFWSRHFEIPWVDEDELSSKERILVEFFLTRFREENLNLKHIVEVDFESARAHLGCH